jgi:DNA-directed RNA polymerase subunit RPC12/RpoP
MRMIVYSCPQCNEELEVSDRMAGRTTRCPSCGEDVTVPEAQGERRERSKPWERGKSPEFREPREPEEHREARSGRRRSGDELSVADLRQVATYQRGVLLCILLYGGLVLAQFGLPPDLRIFLLIPAAPVGIAAAVFVFLMSMKVYKSAGIALAILTFVPCLGLLILLVVNQKATSVLQEHGYQVGFLGASLSQFDKRRRRDDRDD